MKWLADLPATNVRIVVTLAVFVATGIYSGFGQRPIDGEWLVFLGAMAGVDFAQFAAKRLTYKPAPPMPPDVEDAKAGATVKPPLYVPPLAHEPNALRAAIESQQPATATTGAAHQYDEGA